VPCSQDDENDDGARERQFGHIDTLS